MVVAHCAGSAVSRGGGNTTAATSGAFRGWANGGGRGLGWLAAEISAMEAAHGIWVTTVTVYSKCSHSSDLEALPPGWVVRALPNVGRNDHTYAFHIATEYACLEPLVFFIKDKVTPHWSYFKQRRNNLSAVATQLMDSGFACNLEAKPNAPFGPFAWTRQMLSWTMRKAGGCAHRRVLPWRLLANSRIT